jgi:uncharacterized RDD family membrane protein YckC
MPDKTDNPNEETVLQDAEMTTPEPVYAIPPIAGFWRRYIAWSIDTLLLGVVGLVIGFAFSTFFYSIGPYGRPIGLLFILPYFGIMNSKMGGGQTLGKRLMKIAVRNKNNEPIGLDRSIIRIIILYIPVFFNGWAIPLFQNIIVAWFVSLIVFGLGGAILYTMIFNRKSRQGIHDLLVGTYVVNLRAKPVEAFPETSPVHWKILIGWIGFVAVGTLAANYFVSTFITKSSLVFQTGIYNVIQKDPRFFSTSVNDQTFYGTKGKVSHTFIVSVWCKEKLSEDGKVKISDDLAKLVLENEKDITNYDRLSISLTNAFDIGIASGNFNNSYIYTIPEWQKRIF